MTVMQSTSRGPWISSARGLSAPGAIVWVLWLILTGLGLYGLYLRLQYGHILAGYGSYVPWGLWIGLYFLGVGISGGAFLLGGLGFILGLPGFSTRSELRIAISLSVAALIPSFLGVALDLGRTERLLNILAFPSFTSMMAFNAWMYNIFLVVAGLAWLISFKDHSTWLKPLLVAGCFFSILFPSQSGVFFEAVRTNAFWHSPILSVLFLASAVALGSVGLLFTRYMTNLSGKTGASQGQDADQAVGRLRVVAIFAIGTYLVFEFAEFSVAFWNPGAHSKSMIFLLFGDYWPVFWLLHIGLGALIPMALFLSRARALWPIASALAAIGFAAARMSVLVPGQIAGQIPGLQEAFQDPRLVYSYHPTLMEYLVGCLMLAVGIATFVVIQRLSDTIGQWTKQTA